MHTDFFIFNNNDGVLTPSFVGILQDLTPFLFRFVFRYYGRDPVEQGIRQPVALELCQKL